MLNLALLLMGMSMTDPNFAAIVTKPDNVPIVGLIFLLGFFTWLATYQAVQNDERLKQGLEPLEKLDNEKVLVWPDLVYTELICMVALTAFLLVLGDRPAGAAGRAGQRGEDAEPVEGPVVLPGPAGDARLLRSVDGRRGAAEHDHRRADGDSLHRLQQEGQRLLHDRPAEVRLRDVPVRLLGAVGHADRAGHVPPRAELELLRAV